MDPLTQILMPQNQVIPTVQASTGPVSTPPPAPQYSAMMNQQPPEQQQLMQQINRPATTPEEVQARKVGWQQLAEKFSSDPNLMRSLFILGAALGQPIQPGQSKLGHLANAGVTGISAFEMGKYADQQNQLAQREQTRKEDLTGAQIDESAANVEAAKARTGLETEQTKQLQETRDSTIARTEAETEAAQARTEAERKRSKISDLNYETLKSMDNEERAQFLSKSGKYGSTHTGSAAVTRDIYGNLYDKLVQTAPDDPRVRGLTREQFIMNALTQQKSLDATTALKNYVTSMDLMGLEPDKDIIDNYSSLIKANAQARKAATGESGEKKPGTSGATKAAPKEGDKSTSKSGKPIIFHNGRWEYQ